MYAIGLKLTSNDGRTITIFTGIAETRPAAGILKAITHSVYKSVFTGFLTEKVLTINTNWLDQLRPDIGPDFQSKWSVEEIVQPLPEGLVKAPTADEITAAVNLLNNTAAIVFTDEFTNRLREALK